MRHRHFRTIALAAILTLSLYSTAYSQWYTNGEPDEDNASQKTAGDFGTLLMVTNDPDGLFEAWARPPSPDYGPNISTVSEAHRGDVVMAFIVFSGCAENADGVCDTTVTYTAYFPDGSVYGEQSGPLWVGYPDPGKGHLQLSEGNLGLRIETDDPFGLYRIEAEVVDNVSGIELSLSTEIAIVESQ